MRGHAKAFDSAKEELGLTDSLYLGLRTVPVDNIVGSVNRCGTLMPASGSTATMHRYRKIGRRWNRQNSPPVSLYKVRTSMM